MEIRTLGILPITDRSQVAEARRFAAGVARGLHFNEVDAGKLAIVVTEAATNLLKHAGQGELIFNQLRFEDREGLGILALDRGPGIPDLPASLRDGYSTTGSPGTGLGAIMRMASRFDIYSQPQKGTAVLARIWPHHAPDLPAGPLEFGAVTIPMPGEEVCGDAWLASREPGRIRIFVSDGLGHGMLAAEASQMAIRIFTQHNGGPESVLAAIHEALRASRGAAVALADIDLGRRVVSYAGIGNISAVIIGPEREYNMVSHTGTVGHEVRKIQVFSYPWPECGLIVMHTDGLSRRWTLADYPGLATRSPTLLAGVLYRDFHRERDDATVVAAREGAAP